MRYKALRIITLCILTLSYVQSTAGDYSGVGNGGGSERLLFKRKINNFISFLRLIPHHDLILIFENTNLPELEFQVRKTQIIGTKLEDEIYASVNPQKKHNIIFQAKLLEDEMSNNNISIQFDIERYIELTELEQFRVSCEVVMTIAELNDIYDRCTVVTEYASRHLFDYKDNFKHPKEMYTRKYYEYSFLEVASH